MGKNVEYLYQFNWYFRRGGHVEGLIVATEDEIDSLEGQYVYFGEIMGKHSEVYGNLKENDFTKLNVSTDAVAEVSKYLGSCWSGYDPRDYIQYECCQCGHSYSENECNFHDVEDGKMCGYCHDNEEDEVY